MQWNACSIVRHKTELVNYISKIKLEKVPDIICLQETFLKPNKTFKINGYNIIRKDREQSMGGGIAICLKNELSFKLIEPQTKLECVAVEVYSGNSKITIVNVYVPPPMKVYVHKNIINYLNSRQNY